MEEYTIYRLESWSDEQWSEVIEAVEETVASFEFVFGDDEDE